MVNDFKSALYNYDYHKKQKKYYQEKIKNCDVLLGMQRYNTTEIIYEQDEYKKHFTYHDYQVTRIEKFLKKLNAEEYKIINLIFFRRNRYCDVCTNVYMSEKTLQRYIINLIISKR